MNSVNLPSLKGKTKATARVVTSVRQTETLATIISFVSDVSFLKGQSKTLFITLEENLTMDIASGIVILCGFGPDCKKTSLA